MKGCKCGSESTPLREEHRWYVRSSRHMNCFWTYLRHNNRGHTLSEVADLLGLSISAITSIEKKAFAKIRSRIKLLNLEEKE